jgi:nicotinate-nucleotide adenylyltransferase
MPAMRIALYFGSFNPIHTGHLIIASHVANLSEIDQVWFVVSPQNPFKHSNTLLNEYHRLHLVQMATKEDPRLRAMDVEFHLPKPSYTADTLAYLTEKYPQHTFFILMGSDSYQNIDKWKNPKYLQENFHFLVYKRPGFHVPEEPKMNITFLEAPLLEISSTYIRGLIKAGKSIKYLVPDVVAHEIMSNTYYR